MRLAASPTEHPQELLNDRIRNGPDKILTTHHHKDQGRPDSLSRITRLNRSLLPWQPTLNGIFFAWNAACEHLTAKPTEARAQLSIQSKELVQQYLLQQISPS